MISSITKAMSHKMQNKKPLMLSTGSTLLNLACSGKVFGGFRAGHYYFLLGDSDSGKTFLAMTCLAEAASNPKFDDYRFIFDDAEDGALMDKARFFGKKVVKRLEPPAGSKDDPIYSSSAEDFYYNLDDARKVGKPFIYILDSMDALTSSQEGKKFNEQKLAHRKNRKVPGSYGDGKAKMNSSLLRRFVSFLRDTGSILIVISQTRDTMDPFNPKTWSGGHALKFYATLQIWSEQRKAIRKDVGEKKIQQGVLVKVRTKKNRIMGRDRTVEMPIYHSYGIDDLESCIDYLLEWGHWKKNAGKINAKELELVGSKEDLIQQIEEIGMENALRRLVGKVWNGIEKSVEVQRKPRYE